MYVIKNLQSSLHFLKTVLFHKLSPMYLLYRTKFILLMPKIQYIIDKTIYACYNINESTLTAL